MLELKKQTWLLKKQIYQTADLKKLKFVHKGMLIDYQMGFTKKGNALPVTDSGGP
jgi:hypothetical protein